MIVEGYSADFYCDCDACKAESWQQAEADFAGKNHTDCMRQARNAGWRISADKTRCYAPAHKISRNRP